MSKSTILLRQAKSYSVLSNSLNSSHYREKALHCLELAKMYKNEEQTDIIEYVSSDDIDTTTISFIYPLKKAA